jgi:hypothetical protein
MDSAPERLTALTESYRQSAALAPNEERHFSKKRGSMARLFVQSNGVNADPHELNWGITRIGRGSDNDIVINHSSVSYHHCELELGLDSLIVRDYDSTNGTFIGDRKIKETRLEPGQCLRLGQVSVKVEWSREAVSVPKIEPPRPRASVPLPDGVLSCHNHEDLPSVWHCPACDKYFCVSCARGVHLVGRPEHKLCPLCSGHVQLAPWAKGKSRKTSIWGRVKRVLSRTMRMR